MRRVDWFELVFPAGLSTEAAISWVRSLSARGRAGWLSSARPVAFELRADCSGVHWQIGLPEGEAARRRNQLESRLPGVALTPAVGGSGAHDPRPLAVELRLRSARRPLRAQLQPEISRGLLEALHGLRRDEQVVVQWVVGGWLPRSPLPPTADQGVPRDLWHLFDWGRPVLDSEATTQARKKQEEPLFACAGRIAVQAAGEERSRRLVSRVVGAYQVARVPGAGLSRRSLPSWWVRSRMARLQVNQLDPPCVLRSDELVAVLGWPIGLDDEVVLPGVELSPAKLLRPDRRVLRPLNRTERDDDRVVAESAYPAAPGQLVLPVRAATRHLWVVGPTGVGKSTLLARLIHQDIVAGRGVVVVDPKGDLVDDVLVRLPTPALDRVALLDPTDSAPLGLNPLRSVSGSGVAVDGLLSIFHSLWKSSWGPRLHDVLHAGLLTLSLEPGHSLVELPLLLSDPAFRRPLVARARTHDPIGLAGFWSWFDALSPDMAAQVLGPVMNKLRAFVLRSDLRAVLGQESPRVGVHQVFTERRALLVRLPKGQLGAETAALLGSLVVHQVWQATLARSALSARARRPVFVYLDEFQEVVRLPLDLGDALAQARGLGVGLTLAHQHLGQLEPGLRAAVLANAGSRVAFRLDHEDAVVLARRSGGRLSPEDFSRLPAFQAYVDLVAEDAARGFASARTLPLSPVSRPRRRLDGVRRTNRERWGVPKEETEARLRALVNGPGNGVRGDGSGAADGGSTGFGSFGVVPGDADHRDPPSEAGQS